MSKPVILHFVRIALQENRKSFFDGRRRVWYTVCDYMGTDNEPYRKGFESRTRDEVYIPQVGTHADLEARRYQWRVPLVLDIISRDPVYCTCNGCDRIIYEDENWGEHYKKNGGYCLDCVNASEPSGGNVLIARDGLGE